MFKFEPEEFIVEEITGQGEVLEAGKQFSKRDEELKSRNYFFSHFVLQKRLWTTSNAIREVADRLHISANRINFAGNKDRNAMTVQLCSAFAVEPKQLLSLNIKDMKINGAWLSNEKVKLGDLLGNRFTIELNEGNIGGKEFAESSAKKIAAKLKKQNNAIPNYFGQQRFGSARRNTAEVGRLIMQGKFREAMLNYLCFTDENERDERAKGARERLGKDLNYWEALRYFPRYLNHERRILAHLARFPNDHLGAFRKLHRSLQLLFIHAFQSRLFNGMLEERIRGKKLLKAGVGDNYCEINGFGFPDDGEAKKIEGKDDLKMAQKLIKGGKAVLLGKIIGYQTQLDAGEEEFLQKKGLKREDFLLRSTPELSSKGALRPLFVFLKEFSAVDQKEGGKKIIKLRFELPAGSYATVALQEILSYSE